MPKSNQVAEQNNSELKQELRCRLQQRVTIAGLADKIADLLKAFGKRPGTREQVAMRLANELASTFAKQNRELEQLIENRPEQLRDLLGASVLDECQRFIKGNPGVLRLRQSRPKVTTNAERIRRTKASKNRYERRRRRHIGRGLIKREFGEPSGFPLLATPDPPAPSGPCLDEIFHGGTIKMCDRTYSLQSLFGLSRKKLSAAGSGIRRGRETFYDYSAVLACMDALLKQRGPGTHWLPDTERRRTVLIGILFRARQKAAPEISEAFERTLLPHLS
jgi:hypothetical protein